MNREKPWDAKAIRRIENIYERIRSGKRLTKLQDKDLEEYENEHDDAEFNLRVGLNRDFSIQEKQKIVDVCVEAVRKLGYHEVEMS